ncbi:hypothetical protein [Magnetospira sp. QH-2]|uniref:hypothetical protein n=1 Tax=Magnetospira sp. (strain QH-2) TaxID=1288970 RepID=UPI00130E32D9|nr:hypothetical protein [Magnetospira sp. QH-2]
MEELMSLFKTTNDVPEETPSGIEFSKEMQESYGGDECANCYCGNCNNIDRQ